MDKINIYIVNHTHWDREWYKTYDQFRIHLKSGVQRLVDQLDLGEIENFFFDGQTIIIEDLKEVLSITYYEKFINYIKNGQIEVGPWYVLPDEGLIDNIGYEANIEIGENICTELNVKSSKVMYLPDTFGHDISIPKVANKYDINYGIIHRGLNSPQIDVTWDYENYKLKTLVLPTREGYYQTMFHKENYIEEIDKYVNIYLENTDSNDVLILNGCDHTFVPDGFSKKIEELKEKRPNYNIKQVTLSQFFSQANYNYNTHISGELRCNSKAFLLPGVLSTRVYLKIQNREVIDTLKYKYEPLSKELNIQDKEQRNINYLKKEIVKNHPHDSICGCSVDEVHQEMEKRSKKIIDNINTSLYEVLNNKYYFDFTTRKFNNKIVMYNHTNQSSKLVDFAIDVPNDYDIKDKNLYIQSSSGELKAIEIINIKEHEVLYHNIKTEPDYQMVKTLICSARLNLLPYKLNEFELIISDKILKEEDLDVQNDISKDIIDKVINKYINYQVITDKGDTYNFDPKGDYQILNNEIQNIDKRQNYIEVNIKSSTILKLGYNAEEKIRYKEEKPLVVYTKIRFDRANKDLIDFKIKIKNVHENIKLVNVVKVKSKDIYTNTANCLVKREELNNITYEAKVQNEEVNYNQKPTLTDIYLKDQKVQISHIGLNEMEVINDNVYMTILRAVGDLSRRDLTSRNGGAGPSYKTYDAQCIREMNFNILINENKEEYDEDNYLNIYPLLTHQYTEGK